MSLKVAARWALLHGGARALMWRAMRQGDLVASLMRDRHTMADPYPAYEQLRAQGRVVSGRFAYVTVDHEIVHSVLRDNRFGVADPTTLDLPKPVRWLFDVTDQGIQHPVEPPAMLAVNPPAHTRYRKLVSRAFTPRAIEALRPRVEGVAHELLDRLEGRPRADLAEEYAGQLPVTMIAEILGVPLEMRGQFLSWGEALAPTLDIGLPYRMHREAMQALEGLNAWFAGHFRTLRRQPDGSMLSQLVNLVDEGDRLDEQELMATSLLLLGAGFETTVNLIGNGVVVLLEHPEQLAELTADPGLWPNAVEEILRYDSPVQSTGRAALEELDLFGTRIPKGGMVATLLGGANRDPQVFPRPDRFDIHRENAREHVAFSSGIHFCLGAALARIEGEVALRVLFERFPDLTLSGTPHRRPTSTLHGYDRLPVAPGPARRRTSVPA